MIHLSFIHHCISSVAAIVLLITWQFKKMKCKYNDGNCTHEQLMTISMQTDLCSVHSARAALCANHVKTVCAMIMVTCICLDRHLPSYQSTMTSTYLTAEFVERRLTTIPPAAVPDSWGVDSGGHYFQLDLKMCQISALHFDFEWGHER